MPSIARKNLFEDIPRFVVAQAGIMFAVSLVTIQVGILQGFTRSTARLIDQSNVDLWVASEDMVHLELSSAIAAERVMQAQKVEGVDRAEALMIRSSIWRDPSGNITPIRIFGFDPSTRMFAGFGISQGKLDSLKQPYTVMVDQGSLKFLALNQLSDPPESSPANRGSIGSFGTLPAQVVGLTNDTQSIASSIFIFTSLENANAYGTAGMNSAVNCIRQPSGELSCVNNFENQPLKATPVEAPPPRRLSIADPISYVMIRAQSGQDLGQLKQRLQSTLPGTQVYTQAEMSSITRAYWSQRTGVGFVLGLGASVGFIVGMVIVGQILYSSVSDHLREFGTLKAMGASNWVIYSVILEQALWMAVLGYIPSIALCFGLGVWTQAAKGIMILITPATAGGILVLTVVMCVGSALFAVQKVTRVDPAIVFKA
ncbi:ABC transporter permease [Myxacorys almedinensis A]|uniref:ABC transporter permease n=2 Tax=Myxacorys TaxID=2056239 RepID=A0A8J8CJP7_9CYAN|nr:ABC transporter permease [Myxacorys almedinensis A]